MKLAAVVTCWGRGELETSVLHHHAPLFDALVVVVSPDDPDPVDLRPPPRPARLVLRVEAPNNPLGAKHNAGLTKALDAGASHVVVLGSDDYLSARYVATLRELAAAGCEHAALLDGYRLDRRTGRASHEVGPRSDASERVYGSGRMVAARWMRACGGWTPERDRHLDSDLADRLEAAGAPRVRGLRMADAGAACFTTGDVNMWPRWSAHSRPVDVDEVRRLVGCRVVMD